MVERLREVLNGVSHQQRLMIRVFDYFGCNMAESLVELAERAPRVRATNCVVARGRQQGAVSCGQLAVGVAVRLYEGIGDDSWHTIELSDYTYMHEHEWIDECAQALVGSRRGQELTQAQIGVLLQRKLPLGFGADLYVQGLDDFLDMVAEDIGTALPVGPRVQQ